MANERAARGGGTSTSLVVQGGYGSAGADASAGIVTGTPADWFGPSNPLPPVAPPEVRGRTFDFPPGYNLNQRPRAYEAISFEMLRALADNYDLLRLVIETRKDQVCHLAWNITPKDKKKTPDDDALKARIATVEAFFQSPDKVNDWETWLRLILEDLFVLDAPAIYRRKNRGGGLFGLKPLDGATIKRVIDAWGDTPPAPAVAYQQVLKGMGAVNYTADDLIYRPRNPRTNKVYGFSPVEQIIAIVNIALRRETWQLEFFTNGNLPDALIGTPPEWTPEQVRQFQEWFDARLMGQTDRRRGATFVPGEVSKGYVQTKENELFGAAEEWLARVVCFAFSTSPQPFLQMMNRATADTAQDTATKEGLDPIKRWVKALIDRIITVDLKMPDLQFAYVEDDEVDPKTRAEILREDAKAGLITFNEARSAKGMDPRPEPECDHPMVVTATGVVPIGLEQAKQRADALEPPPPAPAKPGSNGKPASGGSGKPAKGPGGGGARKLEDGGRAPATPDDDDPNHPPEAVGPESLEGGENV